MASVISDWLNQVDEDVEDNEFSSDDSYKSENDPDHDKGQKCTACEKYKAEIRERKLDYLNVKTLSLFDQFK